MNDINKRLCEHMIGIYIANLNDILGVSVPLPEVRWTGRGSSILGSCIRPASWHTSNDAPVTLRFNPSYAHALEEQYLEVVAHETCHAVVAHIQPMNTRMGKRTGKWTSHGGVWKGAMRSLGFPGDRQAMLTDQQKRRFLEHKTGCV
jgi:predicted SprT family Zn-dependent metalloprotease